MNVINAFVLLQSAKKIERRCYIFFMSAIVYTIFVKGSEKKYDSYIIRLQVDRNLKSNIKIIDIS
jgi:hypothetical protein